MIIYYRAYNYFLKGGPFAVQNLSQYATCSLLPEMQPFLTSLWSMEASVAAGWALPFPVDHSDIENIVTIRLQPWQHAVSLAALEGEDLLLNVASVSFGRVLNLPVVDLQWQEPASGTHRKPI